MKKKIFIIGILAIVLCGCGKVSKLSNGNDAVVSFDELESISVDSLYDEIKDKYAISVLLDMIDKEILFKEYNDKMDEAKDFANDALKDLKKDYKTDEELLNFLNNYGFPNIEEYKEYEKLRYFKNLATEDYAKKQITDEDIKKYYEDETVGDIEASHILITIDTTDDATNEEKEKAEEKAKKQAEEIIEKLNNGEDFSKLAATYSKDDANKNNGGALGQFNKGDMVSEFEEAAYALKVNEYSKEPVKTSLGYHIIKKTKEYDKLSLDEVKEEIIETLGNELISSDQTISITALKELRNEKGMSIEDSELKSSYNTYLNSQYNYYSSLSTNN